MENLRRRMYTEGSDHMAVANEILKQLGGRKFLVMTGAKDLTGFDSLDAERKWPGLSFKLPIGSAKFVRIALAPSDTYTVQFMTRTGKVIKELDDIYNDKLIEVVEKYTGLKLGFRMDFGRNEENEMPLRRRSGMFEGGSRPDRFQQSEDEIVKVTGPDPGFDTDSEVRKYFKQSVLKKIFPGERIPSQDELDDMAELVIQFKDSSASGLWSKAARRKMKIEDVGTTLRRRGYLFEAQSRKTSAKKAAGKINPLDDVYTRQEKVAKISVPVSPGQAVFYNATNAARMMMQKRFPDWTKEQHAAAVAILEKMEQDNKKEWADIADEAAQETWGRPWRAFDYKVSGIGSDEFSKEFKDRLRENVRFGTAINNAKLAHKVASGK